MQLAARGLMVIRRSPWLPSTPWSMRCPETLSRPEGCSTLVQQKSTHLDPMGIEFIYQLPLELSIAHLASEEAGRARTLLARAVDGARQLSAAGLLPFRCGSLGRIDFWQGRWASARALVHEALRLADDTGWASERPSNLATLARIEALSGHPEEARRHAIESAAASEAVGARTYLAFAQIALGVLELTCWETASGNQPFRRGLRLQ